MSRRRRYQLHQPDLDARIEELLEKAQEAYGSSSGADYVREILVSGLRLVKDKAHRGDLKLLNSALKELRHALRVFREFEQTRKVSVFGSSRTTPEHPDWQQAHAFAERMVHLGWMVITGAGDGIMGAAQGGAGRDKSFGVNIRLPFEQVANEVIAGDEKLINFRFFFTRKVMFVKNSHAIVLFPGGFGTLDEGYETLTLIQTGKSEMVPVVLVDEPGGSYWHDWDEFVCQHLIPRGLISPEDRSLYRVTDDVDSAVHEVLDFYSNYHSSRYVNGTFVIRLRHLPDDEQLETLNQEFQDILTRGRIEASGTLPEENGEVSHLSRLVLHFNRRQLGRLRQLIDRLNALVPEGASHPGQASPREIVAVRLSPEAEESEDD